MGRWYFGGIAGSMAACCTHPVDLIKVHLQTPPGQGQDQSQSKVKLSPVRMAVKVVKNDGVLALYSGLSASILRQLTYSMSRFAIYETARKSLTQDGRQMPFHEKVGVAAVAGAVGGFVGTPGDMVNVRMQNDVKLPKAERRNYKHGLDGLYRVIRDEGPTKAFGGATMATVWASVMTVGQLAFYDQVKGMLLATGQFQDNIYLHVTASAMAGCTATVMTQPLDVLKTCMMNASPAYGSVGACAKDVAQGGPLAFYKGFVPALVRVAPHTVLTFLFLEQLRQNFGDDPP